jgi:SCF-associated factor 1
MTASLTDLPIDILVLIVPHLDAKSFLSLCRTCRGLYQDEFRLDSSYWNHVTRSVFRVRNRPTVGGLHWQRLYKRLLTQSRVYTWGQDANGCLGRGPTNPSRHLMPRGVPRRRAPVTGHNTRTSWPEEMSVPEDFGVIADLQCGGWSTSALNDRGVLMTAGILNGMSQFGFQGQLRPMIYPPGFPQPIQRYDPSVALREFSSGRTHILGLSDSGIVWSWSDVQQPAVQLKFSNLTPIEGTTGAVSEAEGSVRSVVAGWDKSSAYVRGSGIVVWKTVQGLPAEQQDRDTVLISDWAVVPKSWYRRPRGSRREPDESTRMLGQEVGEITNYIVLEHYVVFVTDIHKIFAARTVSGAIDDIFELLNLQALSDTDDSPAAIDVQGSFRSFAVFKRDGAVITTDIDYLDALSRGQLAPPITKIPALQNSGVTSMAFGDYHYHALHSDGSISSYGVEPSACGALGLGGGRGVPVPPGMLRGIKYNPWNADGTLLPHAYFRGRRIWFHPESEKWVANLTQSGQDEGAERVRMCSSIPPVQGEVSEWVEQMGGHWDKRPDVVKKDDDGLGAYFALSIAAAGWHSGALVLVNDDLVNAITESCSSSQPETSSSTAGTPLGDEDNEPEISGSTIIQTLTRLVSGAIGLLGAADTSETTPSAATIDFPRLRLDDGSEMPGEIPFTEWKEPKPDWKLEWRGDEFDGKVFGVKGWTMAE